LYTLEAVVALPQSGSRGICHANQIWIGVIVGAKESGDTQVRVRIGIGIVIAASLTHAQTARGRAYTLGSIEHTCAVHALGVNDAGMTNWELVLCLAGAAARIASRIRRSPVAGVRANLFGISAVAIDTRAICITRVTQTWDNLDGHLTSRSCDVAACVGILTVRSRTAAGLSG